METNKLDEKQMERFSDVLQKRNIVSLFGNEYYENKYFSKKLKKIDKLNQRHLNAEALFYCFLNLGTNLVICSVLCFGKRELRNNKISHGQLISFIAYSSMLGLGIVGMLKLKKEMNVLQMSLHKIYEILDFSHYKLPEKNKKCNTLKNEDIEKVSVTRNTENGNNNVHIQYTNEKRVETETLSETKNKREHSKNNDNQNEFPKNIKGSLKFENVNFSYNSFNGTNKNCVLKNINFEIKEHEKVAIIGKSGSGKTTMWKLLTQEYEYDGIIYIDTYNLKNINKTYFKKKIISISEQECTILNRSLYENLLYGLLPIKIGNRKETAELFFDHVDKDRLLYKKIRALVETIEKEKKKELLNSSPLIEDSVMCITENYNFEDTKCENEKGKSHAYLEKKDKFHNDNDNDDNKTSDFEEKKQKEKEKFLKNNNEELSKNNAVTSLENDNTTTNTNDTKKQKKQKKQNGIPRKMDLSNEDNIMCQSMLKGYENKLDEINMSVKILCEELNLSGFINSLPQEIQSPIQNNSISSGQKQRVAIIRSLMKNTPIYVFDEITSALDDYNVEKVFQTINSLIPDKTVIYITHSVKMLNYMDKIIVVDNGEIALIGTYDEIKNDPLYLNVFPTQNATV